ncbi:hypothetical protein PMIN02_000238 [Paraphaeosphaeria minitans]
MYKLIEYLFNEIPDVTIILSTLILNANAGADERIRKIVNPQYESLVKSLQERQARIMLAGLHSVINAEEMVDGTHPNDKGYEKLAKAWAKAIAEAGRKGILVKPQDPDLTSGCRPRLPILRRLHLPGHPEILIKRYSPPLQWHSPPSQRRSAQSCLPKLSILLMCRALFPWTRSLLRLKLDHGLAALSWEKRPHTSARP